MNFLKYLTSALISGCLLFLPLLASSGAMAETIAFSSYLSGGWQLWSMQSDGTGLIQLTNSGHEAHYPGWSPDGRSLAYADNEGQIWVMQIGGKPKRLPNLPPNCNYPSWSPDGNKIAFVCYSFQDRKEESEIWIANLEKGTVRQLAAQEGIQKYPAWSPDGTTIAYTTGYRMGSNRIIEELWVVDHDGSRPSALVSDDFSNIQPDWSPTGERIAFASDKTGNMDLWVVDKRGKNARQLTSDGSYDGDPSWSPDGSKICFVSTRSGRMEVWLMDSKGGNLRPLTGLSNLEAESKEPSWAP
ncbi:MAG: hypothetical protein GTO24_19145 [candidate division Zixibacteria bacterium]|nr:hypothetical protein [candidate division Zixibacteria bacterium]